MNSDGVYKDLEDGGTFNSEGQNQEVQHGIFKINIDGVYESDLHTLSWLQMENFSNDDLVVKLRSNMGSQIAFQLSNENLALEDDEYLIAESDIDLSKKLKIRHTEGKASPLFSVCMLKPSSKKKDGAIEEFPGRNHNQLFNNVNHITEVELGPKEVRRIVTAFLPNKNNRRKNISNEIPEQRDCSGIESCGFYEVSGLLFFLGYRKKLLSSYNKVSYTHDPAKVNATISDDKPAHSTMLPPDYKLISKFRARVCVSMMHVDIEGAEISFPACTIGTPYHSDFTLTNCSAIKLFWTLNAEDLFNKRKKGEVRFSNPDTGLPLDFLPVAPYSNKKIRVTFVPKEVGEFSYEFQLENVANGNNFITVSINSVVRLDQSKEPVVITPGTTLDFGSCYTNKWTERKITLRSESELPVEVLFYSDIEDVKFRLKGEDLPLSNASQNARDKKSLADSPDPANDIDSLSSLSTYRLPSNSIYGKVNTVHSNENDDNTSSESLLSEYNSVSSDQKYHLKETLATYEQKGDLAALYDYTLSQIRHSLTPSEAIVCDKDVNRYSEEEDEFGEEMEDDMDDGDYRNIPHSILNKRNITPRKESLSSETSILEEHGVVEEIVLRPGTERTIEVLYKQHLDAKTPDFWGGHLIRRDFKIFVHYSVAGSSALKKKTIYCKALTCTSFIQLNPDNINFGDTYINTQKSKVVKVKNMSDLPAKFVCKHSSKVLYIPTEILHIPSNGEVTLKVQIDPRKANPDYRKTIKIVNLYNKYDEQQLNILSTNIDMGYETLNSFFYRVILPASGNFIDFGVATCNSQHVRTFRIFNISKSKISLSLSSSLPEEVEIYGVSNRTEGARMNNSELTELRERTIEIIHPRNVLGGFVNDKPRYSKFNSLQPNILSQNTTTVAPEPSLEFPYHKLLNLESGIQLEKSGLNHAPSHFRAVSGDEHKNVKPNLDNTSSYGMIDLKRISFLDLAVSDAQSNKSPHLINRSSIDTHKKVLTSTDLSRIIGSDNSKVYSNRTNYLQFGGSEVYPNFLPNGVEHKKELMLVSRDFGDGITSEKVKLYHDDVDNYLYNTPLVPGKLFIQNDSIDPNILAGRGSISISFLLSCLEIVTGYYPGSLKNSEQRELYVRSVMCLRRELRYAIKYGRLVPISTLELNSGEESQVILIYTPRSIPALADEGGSVWKDAKVYIKLEQYDKNVIESRLQAPMDLGPEIPLFKLNLRCMLCSSTIRLNQKNINFGYINRHEVYKKSIVILSYSNIPILYSLTKSGSISSGDIIFSEGGVGIVSPFGKKRVEFTFNPTLPGNFHEIINVENVMNPNESQRVTVKATVREKKEFSVSDTYIDFGTVHADKKEISRRYITISNASFKTTKLFEITVNPRDTDMEDFDIELVFEKVEPDSETFLSINAPFPKYILSKEAEERIEVLESKLEIAKRKCRNQTATKILKELQKLRSGVDFYRNDDNDDLNLVFQSSDATANSVPSSVQNKAENLRPDITSHERLPQSSNTQVLSYRRGYNKVYFSVAPRVIQPISIYIQVTIKNPRTLCDGGTNSEHYISSLKLPFKNPKVLDGRREIPVTGSFQIHEYKNRDVIKYVCYSSQLVFEGVENVIDIGPKLVGAEQRSSPSKDYVDSLSSLPIFESDSRNFASASMDPSETALFNRSTISSKVKGPGDPPILVLPSFSSPNYFPDSCECVVCKDLVSGKALDVTHPPYSRYQCIDLGNTTLSVQKSCTLFLVSQSVHKRTINLELDIEESDGYYVTKLERNCNFTEGEKKKIEFSFVPTAHGRRQIVLTINFPQTVHTQMKISYIFYAVYPSYITFPSLTTPSSNSLDIGYCYMDSKSGYVRTTKLPLKNCTRLDIYVTARSNLSQQCFIKLDENKSEDFSLVKVPPLSTIDVYIVLRPKIFMQHVNDDAPTTFSENNCYSAPHIKYFDINPGGGLRKLAGGIKFMIHIPENLNISDICYNHTPGNMYLVSTKTLMFTAVIGTSILKVSNTFINFFSVKGFQDLEGSFEVKNVEYRLPLNFRVRCVPDYVQILPYRSEIPARSANDEKECTEVIRFKLHVKRYGFYSPSIIVENLNNSNQHVVVKVWAFLDPNYLNFIPQKPPTHSIEPIYMEDNDTPIIRWKNASVTYSPFVSKIEDPRSKEYFFANNFKYYHILHKTFEIKNVTQNDLSLRLKSNLKLVVETNLKPKKSDYFLTQKKRLNHDQVPLFYRANRAGTFFVNGVLFVRKGEKQTFRISIPRLLKSKENLSAISNFKVVEQLGVLIFENVHNTKSVKAIFLQSSYCVPCMVLDAKNINIGKVGYINRWEDIEFSFTVTNVSETEIMYELMLPPVISIKSMVEGNISPNELEANQKSVPEVSSIRYVLKALGRVTFNCIFSLKQEDCTQQRDESVTISVVNLYNSLNVNELIVSYIVTTPGIEFSRLYPCGLILNPLKHPHNPDVLPSDTWFAITNTSDTEPAFELIFEMNPEISALVKLTLHSRQSGTPMAGVLKLAPNERIELRLVAQAIDGTRISSTTSLMNITNPEGISYGKLMVLLRTSQHNSGTKGHNTDGNTLICIKEITISGVVVEGNTFKLSTDHLYLVNNTSSDNSDDEVCKSILPYVPSLVQDIVSPETDPAVISVSKAKESIQPEYIEPVSASDGIETDVAFHMVSKRNQLIVTNLMKLLPLEFKFTIEYPVELSNPGNIISVSPVNEGTVAKIDPGGSILLTFSLLDQCIFGSSEDIKVHFVDCASLNQTPQTLYISIGENSTSSFIHT